MKTNFIQEEADFIQRYSISEKAQNFEKLVPGIYKPLVSELTGKIFYEIPKEIDKLIELRGGIISDIFKKIEIFTSKETIFKYKEMKIGHKLGIIFYGPQGTGKTCTAKMLIKELIKSKDSICFDFTGQRTGIIKNVVRDLRTIQDNLLVLFVDEIDASIKDQEEKWLTLLDGADSFDNCIIIGCTNKIEDVPDRIKDRPSRIKYLYEIKAFPDVVYKQYIIDKLPKIDNESLAKIAFLAAENGLTLDQLKHLLIDFYIEGTDIEKNVKTIKKQVE